MISKNALQNLTFLIEYCNINELCNGWDYFIQMRRMSTFHLRFNHFKKQSVTSITVNLLHFFYRSLKKFSKIFRKSVTEILQASFAILFWKLLLLINTILFVKEFAKASSFETIQSRCS